MTVENALRLLEACRSDARGDPVQALNEMVRLYTNLDPEQRRAVLHALRGWMTSDDRTRRNDALFLVHRIRDEPDLTDEEQRQLDELVAESYGGLWERNEPG
jgi:hypothetical protein